MSIKKRISEIPLPENLTDIQTAEYKAFVEAISNLEDQWIDLETGNNPEQKLCIEQIKQIKEKRELQAKERLDLRLKIIEKQYQKECEKIENEQEEYKKLLFDRLMRAYSQSYQMITSQLKDLMGKEFNSFISTNGIEFPTFNPEGQMKTRFQQPEEGKPRLNQSDVDQDIRTIQQIVQGSNYEEYK